jgi:hypothetical protein
VLVVTMSSVPVLLGPVNVTYVAALAPLVTNNAAAKAPAPAEIPSFIAAPPTNNN